MGTDLNAILNAPRLIWRSKLLILLVTLASIAGAWLHVQRSPQSFASETTLLYRFGREYFPVTPGEQRRNWGENVIVSLDAALFTEMRLLTSHLLFEQTIEQVGPQIVEPPRAGAALAQEASLSQLAGRLGSAFDVWRVQGASMVTVRARNSDPALADELLARHVANYMAERERLFNQSGAAFFDAQIAAARADHERVAARLAALTGGEDVAAELAAARAELAGLEAGGPEARAAAGYGEALKAARGWLAEIGDLALEAQPLEAELAAINANLATLEAERADAALSHAYRREVSPVVEVVDRRTALGNAIGLAPVAALAMAGFFGFAFATILVLAAAAVGALRAENAKTA